MVGDTSTALSAVRKAKSDAKVSMRADVSSAVVTGEADILGRLEQAADDLAAAGRIATLTFLPEGGPLTVEVTLAPVDPA